MEARAIIEVEPGSRALRDVLRLHKAAKATLGFLPDEGFADRARRGTLLASAIDAAVVGYVLFDLTRDQVKVRHLCVADDARRSGVARQLIDELKVRHASRRNLVLECRRDYNLNNLWSSLGLRPVHERAGRRRGGSRLTVWEYDFGHPTLFSTVEERRDLACLDHMVVEDLVVEREEGLHSRYLEEDWVEAMVQLCVTDENLREANDADDLDLRTKLLAAVHGHRNLSQPDAYWERHLDQIEQLIPRAGSADHRHVARALEAGADYFITRDDEVLLGADDLQDAFGITVLSPEALVDTLDRQRREDRYDPVVLQGTDLVQERLPAEQAPAFVAALLNHGEGEKAHQLRRMLQRALSRPEDAEVLAVRDEHGAILAGVTREREGDTLKITCLRVRRVDRLTDAIARQLVFQQRSAAADQGLGRVVVTDRVPSAAVVRALPSEYFSPQPNGTFLCEVGRSFVAAVDVLDDPTDAALAAEYERSHWPAKVLRTDLPTYMVSIEPSYAESLFDAHLAATTLFRRQPALGLSREQVFYRSPGSSRNISGPARLLWYVKQKPPGHPVGHLRAVSHLTEVIVDRPRTLHSRFESLGVWSRQEVEGAARRTGEAMALRFSDTELLAKPVSLPALREVYASEGLPFQPPQGPVRVPERVFCRLYESCAAYV